MRTNSLPDFGLPGIYRNHYTSPFFETDGDGDEGGGDGDGDGDGGAASAAGGGNGDGDEDGDDGPAYVFKSEKQKFQFPGMPKPMTVAEYRKTVLDRSQYEGSVKAMSQLAKAIAGRAKGGQPHGQQQPNQQGRQQPIQGQPRQPQGGIDSVLEALENDSNLLTGKQAAGIIRQYQEATVAPLTRAVLKMHEDLKGMRGHVTAHSSRQAEADFAGHVDRVIGGLGLPKLDGGKSIEGSDVLKDLIQDVFYAHNDQDHAALLQGDTLVKLAKARHDALRTYFRNFEKAQLDAARVRQRNKIFAKPGRGASPTGKGGIKRLPTASEMADHLFAGSPNA